MTVSGVQLFVVGHDELENLLHLGEKFSSAPSGILTPSLAPKQIIKLDRLEVSYITLSSGISMWTNMGRVKVEPLSGKPASTLNNPFRKESSTDFPPTLIASPNAFAILDCLFRADEKSLRQYNANMFCKKFGLAQPKLSGMLRQFSINSPHQLKEKIQSFEPEVLIEKFRYGRARQRMTPFYNFQRGFISKLASLEKIWPKIEAEIFMNPYDVYYGPSESLIQAGLLRSPHRSVWVCSERLKAFKRDYRLVPASGNEHENLLNICSPKGSFTKEAIITRFAPRRPEQIDNFGMSNLFRLLWDLGYSDSRHHELQKDLLRKFLNAD